ncbi:MAG TPA: CHASE3 domain-containing protein, partial [Steroidobacteraceae bacterium]|nr:CHASE3 domain-containing protein [Steroidobacteraceae bacterium]
MEINKQTELTIRAGFGVALALLVVIGVISYVSVLQLSQNSANVAHSHEVMQGIDQMVGATSEAEAAHRAFIISGDEKFVREYDAVVSSTGTLNDRLRELVADDREQAQRLKELQQAIDTRFARSAQAIELRRTGGLDAVLSMATHGQPGSVLQSKVREIAQDMKTAERALLDGREQRVQHSASVTQGVIVGGSLFALVFVGLALLSIRRAFAARARAEGELAQF